MKEVHIALEQHQGE